MAKARKDAPVRIDQAVLADVRIAAAFLGVGVSEFINDTLRPAADKVIREESAKRTKDDKPKR